MAKAIQVIEESKRLSELTYITYKRYVETTFSVLLASITGTAFVMFTNQSSCLSSSSRQYRTSMVNSGSFKALAIAIFLLHI